MNILGIMAMGMNPAACLLRDGKIVSFAEEERFTRLKTSDKMFPTKAVAYCLDHSKLSLGAVDRIAFGWDATKYPWAVSRVFGLNYMKYKAREMHAYHREKDGSSVVSVVENLLEWHPSRVRTKLCAGLRAAGLKGDVPEIEFVPHHLAHAYSSYFCSPFNRAGILSIDGSGEGDCSQLAVAEGNDVRVVESINIPDSLGWFYAAITEYLGFVPYRDEGKLMGLAAYGEARKAGNKWLAPLSQILKIKDGSYGVNPVYTRFGSHYYGHSFTDEMVRFMKSVDPGAEPIAYGEKVPAEGRFKSKYLLDVYIDIAWAAQELLEQAAIMLAKKLVNDHKTENLCIAGGVGLNCKMNGEILRRSGCKNIFVQPASSDAGAAIGAAMYTAKINGDDVRNPLSNAYTGPGFSDDEIYAALKNCKLRFEETGDPADAAAKMLEEGKIIAWFQGRMECGPRALGNRSILANPAVKGIKDRVNSEVKYRESWRPFCPSMTNEARGRYIKDPKEASFMIVAYEAEEIMKKELPSLVHVDGTVRPQSVTGEANPLFHALIKDLGRRTGHPVVLNTSFNVRGEPIVCTPQEAIRCFYSNGLDALVLGRFILKKDR